MYVKYISRNLLKSVLGDYIENKAYKNPKTFPYPSYMQNQ